MNTSLNKKVVWEDIKRRTKSKHVFLAQHAKTESQSIDALNCGAGEDSWGSLGLLEDQTSQSQRKSTLNFHWKDWCWSWSSNTLATGCKELTHWKRLWFWERLKAGGEGDDSRWDGRWHHHGITMDMSLSKLQELVMDRKPGVLQSMELQRVWHDLSTEQHQARDQVDIIHIQANELMVWFSCFSKYTFPEQTWKLFNQSFWGI